MGLQICLTNDLFRVWMGKIGIQMYLKTSLCCLTFTVNVQCLLFTSADFTLPRNEAFLRADILTGWKTTSVSNRMNDGLVPLRCLNFRVHADSLSQCSGDAKWTEPMIMLLTTHMFLFVQTHAVEKKKVLQNTINWNTECSAKIVPAYPAHLDLAG